MWSEVFGSGRSIAYPLSHDGATVLARAWCEAVVQRTPEFLDSAHTPPANLKSEANKSFGRRFVIRAFRWLGRDEV